MEINRTGAGSPFMVNFILKVPSGEVFHRIGYLDFTADVNATRSRTARLQIENLTAVGEVQSP